MENNRWRAVRRPTWETRVNDLLYCQVLRLRLPPLRPVLAPVTRGMSLRVY